MTPPRPVFLFRPDGRIDYAAMRNAATKGTKSSRQHRAEAARAARKAARMAEKAQASKTRIRALPPRELPNGID